MPSRGELIRRGAEADLYLGDWFGQKAVFKVREPKHYRRPQLDKELRERRTLHEAAFLRRARQADVPSPLVFYADPDRAELVMQYIPGRRLKEVLADHASETSDELCRSAGESAAKLHLANIVHGDLTTSNFIAHPSGRLVLLDFGLSFLSPRLEDRAVDLHLIKEILVSAHEDKAARVFRLISEGYAHIAGERALQPTLAKIREIERRGRYGKLA